MTPPCLIICMILCRPRRKGLIGVCSPPHSRAVCFDDGLGLFPQTHKCDQVWWYVPDGHEGITEEESHRLFKEEGWAQLLTWETDGFLGKWACPFLRILFVGSFKGKPKGKHFFWGCPKKDTPNCRKQANNMKSLQRTKDQPRQ